MSVNIGPVLVTGPRRPGEHKVVSSWFLQGALLSAARPRQGPVGLLFSSGSRSRSRTLGSCPTSLVLDSLGEITLLSETLSGGSFVL